MAEKPNITRRNLFGAGIALAALAAPVAVAAQDGGWDDLERRLDAHAATTERLQGGRPVAAVADFERWEAEETRLMREIEAKPATDLRGLRVKAKAFKVIHLDEFDTAGAEMLNDQRTTDVRLAMQIIRSLVEAA